MAGPEKPGSMSMSAVSSYPWSEKSGQATSSRFLPGRAKSRKIYLRVNAHEI
jgi:hypothetical protein